MKCVCRVELLRPFSFSKNSMMQRRGSGRRRSSLLDQMQRVAEEQESEDLSRSFHSSAVDEEQDDSQFGGSGAELFPDEVGDSDGDEDDDEMAMVQVLEMINQGGAERGTIFEEEHGYHEI